MRNKCKASEESIQLKLGITLGTAVRSQTAATSSSKRGRAKTRFIAYQVPHLVLLPNEMSSLLPPEHLGWSISKAVRDLDLTVILAKYSGKAAAGRSAFDPVMMLTVIIYCYCEGQTSTRAMEKMCRENIPCRVLAGGSTPDHDTFDNFLLLHRCSFLDIFQQVLLMVDRADLIELDHVSVDGSKINANASKRKAMSYQRMRSQIRKLKAELRDFRHQLKQARRRKDAAAERKIRMLNHEIDFRQLRLTKIESAKKDLEDRVRTNHETKALAEKSRRSDKRYSRSKRPKPSDQINFTDPESRIMHKSGKHFEQSYNAQIVVDKHAQIIVACDVVQDANDKKMLEPMLKQVVKRLARVPGRASADSGYFSEENLSKPVASLIDLFIPPNREGYSRNSTPTTGRIPKSLPAPDRMRRKLSTKLGKELYAQRKFIVEPVYGQIKHSVLAFDHFSWRGLQNARYQWALVCSAHNLLKLHRNRPKFTATPPPNLQTAA